MTVDHSNTTVDTTDNTAQSDILKSEKNEFKQKKRKQKANKCDQDDELSTKKSKTHTSDPLESASVKATLPSDHKKDMFIDNDELIVMNHAKDVYQHHPDLSATKKNTDMKEPHPDNHGNVTILLFYAYCEPPMTRKEQDDAISFCYKTLSDLGTVIFLLL
jgi:hypothetical protein